MLSHHLDSLFSVRHVVILRRRGAVVVVVITHSRTSLARQRRILKVTQGCPDTRMGSQLSGSREPFPRVDPGINRIALDYKLYLGPLLAQISSANKILQGLPDLSIE